MLMLFVQSSLGQLELPDFGIDWFDKILHFVVFGILGFLTTRGMNHSSNQFLKQKYFAMGILISVLYSITDEVHQYFVPGRYASLLDLIADILGIIMFAWIYRRFLINKNKQLENKKLSENRTVV
jgi:VanZ family protein